MASRTTTRVPLGELATIRSGYQDVASRRAKGREDYADKTGAALLTPMALRESARVDFNAIEMIEVSPEVLERHRIQAGDILFQSRGQTFTAVGPPAETPSGDPIIPSFVFMHLRLKPGSHIAPRYLEWYLSQRTTQAELASIVRGVAVQRINARDLRGFEIAVPCADVQRRIADLQARLSEYLEAQQEEASALRNWVAAETGELLRSTMDEVGHAN